MTGNGIGDSGLKLLLRGIERHPSIRDLSLGFNDISPEGSAHLIAILPKTKLKFVDLSRNIVEDESLIMLGDLYRSGQNVQLTKINFSSCRITDCGLLYIMESIEDNKLLKDINFRDNFISENSEKILCELMEKNHHLIKLDLHGNRISLSCLSRVNKLLNRNIHDYDFKEPNRLNNTVPIFFLKNSRFTGCSMRNEKSSKLRKIF